MSARSRLNQREIQAILKALRNLDRKKRLGGEVVATAGEILSEENEEVFERDSATDDTRVRVALACLEEADLLTREENRAQIFPSSLIVRSVEAVSYTHLDVYKRQIRNWTPVWPWRSFGTSKTPCAPSKNPRQTCCSPGTG